MANTHLSDASLMRVQPKSRQRRRPNVLICKAGPPEAIELCMMNLSRETEVEHISTLAEGMQRCLQGGVDILFVNLFTFTARELTALAAFRSLRPSQPVVGLAGPEMEDAFIGCDLVDHVRIVPPFVHSSTHPRA